ncbi:uncharacterized protein LOC128673597 isoform X2 [Plodia interpunctella]|nr:uncharacterized protein LOC128673597 isoform X2 [Plodia interpunctella]
MHEIVTKSIEEMAIDYDDDKNAMLALETKENVHFYDDFYDEFDPRSNQQQSMNMIFFGPPISFMRIDPETILHILMYTKRHLIPVSRALLAWDIVTDGKTAAFLQGREYVAFSSLLNVVPEEDLYYANFGDNTVLNYFSSTFVDLNNRKFGVLVAAFRRYYGDMWYDNSTIINKLGYMICGFPSFDLQNISPVIFKEITVDVLSRLRRCNPGQMKTLYNIATHPLAYGEPYKWSSHEIIRLDNLFNCIPEEDIGSLQLEAISAISPAVMKSMKQEKLDYFTKEQIQRMHPKTRRIFILRMQLSVSLDMNLITNRGPVLGFVTILKFVVCLIFLLT